MSFSLNFQNSAEKKTHLDSLIDIPSINPSKYDRRTRYNRLDFLIHDSFGPGFVEDILENNKISVYFSHGPEVLEHNRLEHLAS